MADVKQEAPSSKPDAPTLRGIVRIAGKDMKGPMPLGRALSKIKGIGQNLANSLAIKIEKELAIPRSTKVGSLSDNQITSIEEVVRNPSKHGVKPFLVNRQKDDDTGEHKQLIQSDLDFSVRQEVEKEKNLRTWIGWRHSLGQRVRGQHNRTTGRSGMTVGVLKKAVKAQREAVSKGAQEKAAAAPAAKK